MNESINGFVGGIVGLLGEALLPSMVFVFFGGIALRSVIYYTVRREFWFVKEFEKRVAAKLDSESAADGMGFFRYSRRILERTYFEVFELRARYKRRNPDHIMSVSDRLFLVQDGSARLVRDTLKRLRYLEDRNSRPDFAEVSKVVFNSNPAFSRVFGIVPASTCNAVLDILPGLFIIAGIFGTFIGIMTALPLLSQMDLANPENTKAAMDNFLLQMAFKFKASILGIMLSVMMNIFNSVVDPEGLFVTIVDRYSSVLATVWSRCQVSAGTSLSDSTDAGFYDEDELEAREALERQLSKPSLFAPRQAQETVPQPLPEDEYANVEPISSEPPAPEESEPQEDNEFERKKSA